MHELYTKAEIMIRISVAGQGEVNKVYTQTQIMIHVCVVGQGIVNEANNLLSQLWYCISSTARIDLKEKLQPVYGLKQ